MGWKHIVVEGHCMFGLEENQELPKCCIGKPDDVGLHCLKFESGKYCPYFAFGTARASIVVTDGNGNAVTGTCFFPKDGLDLSEEEWHIRENKWIEKWTKKIQDKDND